MTATPPTSDPGAREDGFGRSAARIFVGAATIGVALSAVIWGIGQTSEPDPVTPTREALRHLQGVLDLYALTHDHTYPTTAEGLAALAGVLSGDDPPVDAWGHPYVYASPGTAGRPYDLSSLGADGKVGGDGLAADLSAWDGP